jgi:hypothetical protein
LKNTNGRKIIRFGISATIKTSITLTAFNPQQWPSKGVQKYFQTNREDKR